jgi:hypothetical protein
MVKFRYVTSGNTNPDCLRTEGQLLVPLKTSIKKTRLTTPDMQCQKI